jgi:hypothetical protein
MNSKRKLIEEAVNHMDDEFRVSDICSYACQISHHGLTRQEVCHILPTISGLSLIGKIREDYLYRKGYVNIYVKQ